VRLLYRVGLAVLLCLGSSIGSAQERPDVPAANPMMLAKAILAVRGGESDRTQLQLVFDRARNGEALAPLTAWIGADYFALVDGDRLTITDLKLLRRFVVDRQAGTLVNLSLYGDVMLRHIEVVRRMKIAAALTKKGGDAELPQSLDQFWIESELGIGAPGKPVSAIVPNQGGDRTQFLYNGQEVAAVTLSGTGVPTNLSHSYGTFLRRTLPLHPSIARWLSESGQVPRELAFTSEARGETDKIVLRLRSANTVSADFPMPPHMTLLLLPWGTNDPDAALLRDVLPHMLEAMTLRTNDRTNEIARSQATIAHDFADGHKFAAALSLTELALRWGRSATECIPGPAGSCRKKEEIERLLGDDPRAVAMFKAAALQDQEPAKALAIWGSLDRHDVANGYVVDIFLARLFSESGDRVAAAKSFSAAFAGDPSIGMLYRELGDHFARVSRLDLAWLCYDLGRALPNREKPDALTSVDNLEQGLFQAYPEMF
jgi:tetratricopeptide (TPR) repeat protein